MPPKTTEFSRIFAKRAACAGISLALALALTGCPRPAPPAVTPAQITSVFTVGTIALSTGDPRALDRLSRALKLAPQEPAIWANLGLYRLRNNELDAAAFDLERARSLTPPDAPASSRAAILALLALAADLHGDVNGAVAHYQQAATLDPDDLKIRYALYKQQEKAGDDMAALHTVQDIARARPDNLDVLLNTARLAARQNDAATLRPLVARIEALSANWLPDSKEQVADLKTASQAPSVRRATVSVIKLLNTLKQQPEWRVSYAALNPPLDNLSNPVLGTPLERFVRLPNVADSPAPADMGLTFAPALIMQGKETGGQGDREKETPAPFAGALWLNNSGEPGSLVAPFAMWADGRALHIDAPPYANQSLPFPGGPNAVPPGAHGVLALDFDYDLRADILMAGAGGIKLYLQDEKAQYKDATSHMKLPPDVLNGAYMGAWGLDYDTDGDLDILLARTNGPPLALRNNGDGTFKPVALFPDVTGLRDFAWADVDGDGSPDAALVDGEGNLRVYMNERSGKFRLRALPPDVGKIAAIATADLDNDGKIDFILLRTDGAIVRLSDRMDGTQWDMAVLAQWPNPPQGLLAPGTARLLIADLDNNGALDILASTPDTARIWLNDGAKLTSLPAPINAGVQAVADLDGDGRLDLLGIDAQGHAVKLTNRGTKNYFWQDIRLRADQKGDVDLSRNRKYAEAGQLSKRVNSYGIGGEVEMRAGLLYQKQVITAPSAHFGLGTYPTMDAARILWPNGDVRGEFEVKNNQIFSANHRLNVSCPFLFTWDGAEMTFVTDCIWRSPLGLKINAQDTHGVAMTEDWVKIRGDQLQPRKETGNREQGTAGSAIDMPLANAPTFQPRDSDCSLFPVPCSLTYDLRITADLWETHFFDHLSLMVVDHPVGTEIYCDERFAIPAPPLRVYCTTPPRPVARAWDDDGNDVTDIVRSRDGRHVANFPKGAYQGVTRDHWLALELPDDAPTDGPLYLIAQGWVHPTNSSVNMALSQGDTPAPQGLVLDAMGLDGQWHTRKEDLGFPAGKLKTVVLRVDDALLPDAPPILRLRTNLEVYWEAIGWAVGLPDAPVQTTRLAARAADLRYRGFSEIMARDDSSPELPVSYDDLECVGQKWRDLEGYYTRYGDVRELLADIDDRYVIMNAGDEMRLTFDAPPPRGDGWTRDFVLIGDGWVKDGNPNTAFSKTVLPLPAHDQTGYDTPPTFLEADPIYQRHAHDWQTYHTRYVTADRFQRSLRPLTSV